MFIIDTCSGIISGYLLWRVCSIDLLRETIKVIKDYWVIIAVNIANYLNYVSLLDTHNLKFLVFSSY